MLFVNRIAHILHSIVVQCTGAANKNIGDAFLLTWKLNTDEMKQGGRQEFVADQALLSLLKTTAEMARYEDFICNFSSTALAVLYERMPGYKCKMGCGLHMGWAVEGAIGSDKKIDASYISPHVNWAEFLESSTKEYGVPVLMSEPFFRLLSPAVKSYCRQVDNIKKSASDEVTGLYTYDVNPHYDFKIDAITEGSRGSAAPRHNKNRRSTRTSGHSSTPTMTKKELAAHTLDLHKGTKNSRRTKGRGELDAAKLSVTQDEDSFSSPPTTSASLGEAAVPPTKRNTATGSLGDAPIIILPRYTTEIWDVDPDLVAMRTHMSDLIHSTFREGMDSFIAGDWEKAKEKFEETLSITENQDGPSKNILRHMQDDYANVKPPTWKGYRDMS